MPLRTRCRGPHRRSCTAGIDLAVSTRPQGWSSSVVVTARSTETTTRRARSPIGPAATTRSGVESSVGGEELEHVVVRERGADAALASDDLGCGPERV